MTSTPTSPPPATTPGPAVTVPAFAVTWPKLLALCGTILLAFGGGYLGLINVIYGQLNDSITQVDARVTELRSTVLGAAKDAGAFQTLMTEAPELRKNIQDTHDAVIKLGDRFDNVDRSLATLNASVNTLAGSRDRDNLGESLSEIRARLSGIENSIQRIPGMPK